MREMSSDERSFVAQASTLFERATTGWINDGRSDEVHFDIYTPEMYVLGEPFARRLGPSWLTGLRLLLSDLAKVVHPGGAVTWGRSVGPLALAMTIELAALAATHLTSSEAADWLAPADDAAADLEMWFNRGVVVAGSISATDAYRGPVRRLQMTFDLLGKMAWSAMHLSARNDLQVPERPSRDHIDTLINLPDGAAIWAYRSRLLSLTLPLMFGTTADYLPSPRAPGVFEQPTDGPPLLIPAIRVLGPAGEEICYVPTGRPTTLSHTPNTLVLRQEQWLPLNDHRSSVVDGTRTATYTVIGRDLEVAEIIELSEVPADAVLTITAGEKHSQPLELATNRQIVQTSVETHGFPEWRTPWGEIAQVQEMSLPIGREKSAAFTWKVTREPVVATTEPDHPYTRCLYDAMPGVVVRPVGAPDYQLRRRLRGTDILHMSWPERWPGLNLEHAGFVIDQIKSAGIKIVWTQHNLLPHRVRTPEAQDAYQLWAEAADAVIHHSAYGMRIALGFRHYPNARHFVVPHGHWGAFFPKPTPKRCVIENEEGWPRTNVRLAVIGQPRHEKRLQDVVDAFADCSRDDVQLIARVSSDVVIGTTPNLIATYGHVDAQRYYRRLCAVDGILLPFIGDTMVTTGTAFDCIGGGIAAVISPWGFLKETFGKSALAYDGTKQGLTRCFEEVSRESLRKFGLAASRLRPAHDWSAIGRETKEVLERIVDEGT
jgi:glycosyltransferase involved in cell wall biosynthesis